MKRKIYYIDTNSYEDFHEEFNAASLKSFSFVCEEIKYVSHITSKKCVDKVLDKPIKNLSYFRIRFPKETSNFRYLLKLILTALYNILFVIFSEKEAIVVYNFDNILSLHLVNRINRVFKKKIIVICHGELEFLYEDMHNGFIKKRIKGYFLNKNVTISDRIYYMVLGDSILKNIEEKIDSEKFKHFISIDHPYLFKSKVSVCKKQDGNIRIGTIGTMSNSKGLNELLFLEKSIPESSNVILSITGRIIDGIVPLSYSSIDYPNKNGEILAREDMERRISELDYVLFLYPGSSYRTIASGALLDAINSEKVILSFTNSYFEYIFNKFGHVGYMVDDQKEMSELILKIDKGVLSDSFDFKKIKKALSPEIIANNILIIFTRIGY